MCCKIYANYQRIVQYAGLANVTTYNRCACVPYLGFCGLTDLINKKFYEEK